MGDEYKYNFICNKKALIIGLYYIMPMKVFDQRRCTRLTCQTY